MDAAAEQLADVEAYVDGDRRVTFGQWLADADALAAALVERGVRPGDVVAIMVPPSIDFAVALAAVLRAGAVATGLNTRLGPGEAEPIAAKCQPVLAFVPGGDAPSKLPPGLATMGPDDLEAATKGPGLGGARPGGDA